MGVRNVNGQAQLPGAHKHGMHVSKGWSLVARLHWLALQDLTGGRVEKPESVRDASIMAFQCMATRLPHRLHV